MIIIKKINIILNNNNSTLKKIKIFHFRQYCIMFTTFDDPRVWGV